MTFQINFFELMFLAESVIPPNPIARSMCFDDFSEKHYKKMTSNQRSQFFDHVKKQWKFDIEDEQCRHFYARFNPQNQFLVTAKNQEIECYYFNGKYHISMNSHLNDSYIMKIVRLHDNEEIPLINE